VDIEASEAREVGVLANPDLSEASEIEVVCLMHSPH
jgi:hypothetical protein